MQTHTMTFKSFQDKRVAVDWIKETIEPDNFDEKLTELQIVFFTGVQPRKAIIERMLRDVAHVTYESHDS
jgi:hypothetical protein